MGRSERNSSHLPRSAAIGFFLMFILAACGDAKTSSDRTEPENSTTESGQNLTAESAENPDSTTGVCGENVATEYQIMAGQCSELLSQEQADQCLSTVESFLKRYPDMDCEAELQSPIYGQTDTVRITEEKVLWIKNAVSSLAI